MNPPPSRTPVTVFAPTDEAFQVDGASSMVNDAHIEAVDIEATHGVIRVIDTLLLLPTE
jgi:uncharacterized surface protein with fasciclin (FAS1) repeats